MNTWFDQIKASVLSLELRVFFVYTTQRLWNLGYWLCRCWKITFLYSIDLCSAGLLLFYLFIVSCFFYFEYKIGVWILLEATNISFWAILVNLMNEERSEDLERGWWLEKRNRLLCGEHVTLTVFRGNHEIEIILRRFWKCCEFVSEVTAMTFQLLVFEPAQPGREASIVWLTTTTPESSWWELTTNTFVFLAFQRWAQSNVITNKAANLGNI